MFQDILNSLISMKIISMDHITFLVKVELTWVEDPGSSHKCSWRFPINTLITCRIKVAHNVLKITHINFLEK